MNLTNCRMSYKDRWCYRIIFKDFFSLPTVNYNAVHDLLFAGGD
jgi:hypothetical protein